MSELTDFLLPGPQSASALRHHLQVSQATFSRLAAAEPLVMQFGKARATRYTLLRPIRGQHRFPLWQVDEQGKAWKFGDLYPCWPQGSCLVALENGEWQWFSGLPWYLSDLRPQGFLGRAWGRRLAASLNLPDDIRYWQEEDILFALTLFSGENQGGWLIGEAAWQRWLQAAAPELITMADKLERYARLAQDALAGDVVGSSAGGEQPKFTCFADVGHEQAHVLVKFTAPQSHAIAVRWADLLTCESLALQTLEGAGVAVSQTRLLKHDSGQVFLEAQRFDCCGVSGRRAIVSLEAVQGEFVASRGHWPQVVNQLAAQKQTTAHTARRVAKIWAFGRLIANSDMHAGNLSFFLSDAPLALTPVYDMLPMAFAPNSAGAMREESVALTFDAAVEADAWRFALPLAKAYWQKVADDGRISTAFRAIARQMSAQLLPIERIVARLS
nr:type II toxin-antitoxin system HipA family toxin YjjJ [uncultured Enterobacter sp.]